MTPILKVITEYCAVYVDDINLQALAEEDMPLYARRMWGYFRPSIPLFNLPAEMPIYLMGTPENPKLTEPIYGSFQYITETDLTSDFVLPLDDSGKGYELFCCRIRAYDDFENVVMLPTSVATYDSENGTVTFKATPDNPIPKGTIFDMDFYKDGYFTETLSPEIMNILGMCFQIVWQTRFMNDWLSNVSKVEDKSFYEQNRANKIKADNERLNVLKVNLAEAMRRLEQNLAHRKMFPIGRGLI